MVKERAEIIKFIGKYDKIQSIMRYINENTLRDSYWRVMEGGNEKIGAEYGEKLDENIRNLLRRMKNFSYFPQSKKNKLNIADQNYEYAVRTFEDEIVQWTFREILEAIYKPKIQHSVVDIKKMKPIKKSKVKVYVAWIKVDIEMFLIKINSEYLITFLKQNIDDKNFIRYMRRFLHSGVKLCEDCTDSKDKSKVPFLSMMRNVCEYYMLQILGAAQEWGLDSGMSVRREDKNFWYLFDNVEDAKIIYRRLYQKLKERGFDLTKDRICTLSIVLNNKRQYGKISLARKSTIRASNRKVKFGPAKEQVMETSDL